MKTVNCYSKNDMLHKFLDKDLDTFLLRLSKVYWNEMTFSQILPKWDKEISGISKKIIKKSAYKYPGHIQAVVNVHRVMMKYYSFHLDIEDYLISERIEDVLFNDIHKYMYALRQERFKKGKGPKLATTRKAIKELKARGFIPIEEYDDFDPTLSQIMTKKGLKPKLVYPENFISSDNRRRYWWLMPHVYNIGPLIGVQGFTRISTPKDR